MAKVKVAQGWLKGEQLKTVTEDTTYYSFKGIPYAEPPLGKLRFKAPRPPLSWDEVRDATEHGPECSQLDVFTNELILESEDCLYLNVYSRDLNPKTRLPVMFYIHGGGFKSGSGNDSHYGPDFLVAHDIVLVTINYRLDIFGFLCLDTEDVPGNAGLKDQVAALKWVQENISHFGGDPDNVTIFGQSAGGASVVYHILSPLSKGLFRRAISMSGVPICDWAIPYQPCRRAFTLGKHLGLDTTDPNELLDFLQNLPVEKIVDTNPYLTASEERSNSVRKMYHYTPVVEKNFGKDHFLTENPVDAAKNGRINEVDLLIGHTSEEYLFAIQRFESMAINVHKKYPELFVPREILTKARPDLILELSDRIINHFHGDKKVDVNAIKEFTSYSSESYFVYNIYRFLRIMPKIGNVKRYFYKFSCVSDRNVYGNIGLQYGISGAAHLDDLMYLFHARKFGLELKNGSKEYQLIQLVCKIFTNFAKYGTPTPDTSLGGVWPEYDNDTKSYGEIGDTLTIEQNLGAGAINFWKSIYEYAGLEF